MHSATVGVIRAGHAHAHVRAVSLAHHQQQPAPGWQLPPGSGVLTAIDRQLLDLLHVHIQHLLNAVKLLQVADFLACGLAQVEDWRAKRRGRRPQRI